MRFVDCNTMYLPFLCKKLGYCPSAWAQCITCVDETGKPLAGVIYDAYNGVSVNAHIWMEGRPHKEWFVAIFDYPFNKLGVTKVVGQVGGNNKKAQLLDQHFGFVEEGRVRDYSEDGDLLMYTMTRDQCRVLNSPLWNQTVRLVEAVA